MNFRVWDFKKIYYSGINSEWILSTNPHNLKPCFSIPINGGYIRSSNIDRGTGNKSSSGIEIFEGDFLEIKNSIGKVEWSSDHGGFILWFLDSKNKSHVMLNGNLAFISEIKGNHWENPNLTLTTMPNLD